MNSHLLHIEATNWPEKHCQMIFPLFNFSFGTITNWFGTPWSMEESNNCTYRPTTFGDPTLCCTISKLQLCISPALVFIHDGAV